MIAFAFALFFGAILAQTSAADTPREVRGTWLTTTANDAISSPEKTAATMRRLREIGLNTVYVECWKNGYTQYPSKVLERTIGVDRRPALMKQDPSDQPATVKVAGRDLVLETLTEAHRNGLVYIAWFEYGFMAAHGSTDNHLRRTKPEWLSKDIKGNTVAPNGFVWMNPLHPECRRFLTDLVLEAIDHYDFDGIQLDDRIVWPHITMGYDEYTRGIYAQEHGGAQPPEDCRDPAWIRWRADKVNEYARQFVTEVRAERPGLVISLSPAPYPWVYENYCLEWPKWAASDWNVTIAGDTSAAAPGWDEFIPQNYRFSYADFEKTWMQQLDEWRGHAGGRSVAALLPGIRIVGDGKDSSWEQLRDSIELGRRSGNGGHVLWFSRGVLDVYPEQLKALYDVEHKGFATNPHFPVDWRPQAVAMRSAGEFKGGNLWELDAAEAPAPPFTVIALAKNAWHVLHESWSPVETDVQATGAKPLIRLQTGHLSIEAKQPPASGAPWDGSSMEGYEAVEIIPDRRGAMAKPRPDRSVRPAKSGR